MHQIKSSQFIFLSVSLALLALPSVCAFAQAAPTVGRHETLPLRADAALGFSYVRSNAPPGGDIGINLNGGFASVAFPIRSTRFSVVADVQVVHGAQISSSNYGLTLTTILAGARYSPQMPPRVEAWRVHPFGQVLAGVTHAEGSLVANQTAAGNAGATFASQIGGGLDVAVSRHLWVRAAEIDYQLTTFDNGSSNTQNNLRVNSGIVWKF